MADIRDEHGRPIQLTDDLGRPVQLTDEHGNPIHLTGVATTVGSTPHMTIGSELRDKSTHDEATQTAVDSETQGGGTHFAPTPVDYAKRGAGAVAGAGAATVGAVAGAGKAVTGAVTGGGVTERRTGHDVVGEDKKQLERSSSSSSSSEDDGQGGRRKKKGFMQKMKEKLPGHSAKDSSGTQTKMGSNTVGAAPGIAVEHHEQEHEKKGFLEKIKDKLPGHH